MPGGLVQGGGLDPKLRDNLNNYLRLSDNHPASHVPLWGRVEPGEPGTKSPISLKSLCANKVVASAHMPSVQS